MSEYTAQLLLEHAKDWNPVFVMFLFINILAFLFVLWKSRRGE